MISSYEYAREGKPLPDGKKVEARKVTVEDVELLAFEPIPEAPTDAAPAHAADSGENVGDDAPAVAPADVKGPTFSVRVVSSGGFYVRSFIHDLGEEFGSSAFMISLQRTRQGKMKLEDALDVSNLDLVKVCDAIEEAKKLK